ncbi:MAG: RimK family alpha-L-glutamate ligase [Candidatus Riflebacteria bacterium]|nr:RimK family alpha-L-glutamate ligase [Candidatus Riflebacteria bacterium]
MAFDDRQSHTESKDQEPLIGLPALMRMVFENVDLTPLGMRLLDRVKNHPNDANAFMDMSIILQFRGKRDVGIAMQAEALKMQSIYRFPTTGNQSGIRVLAIMGPGDLMVNTPLEFLLEDSDITLYMVYIKPGQPFPSSLPDHDLVFVAISESDQTHALLQHVGKLLETWPRKVINLPARINILSRDSACALLQNLPGVVMPITARVYRRTLERIGLTELPISSILADCKFPVIVRPVDSHAGHGLARLDQLADVEGFLSTSPEHEFYIARFVDYSGSDGLFRKCRIVLIKGQPFICHMAVSPRWMVHYLNADMMKNAENRAEEARFMASFDDDFARRHAEAFHAINERIGLDYLGIDCGETINGQLLIFEVDSNMIVHAMDPIDIFPYKQPQMRKVFNAFRQMLINEVKEFQK